MDVVVSFACFVYLWFPEWHCKAGFGLLMIMETCCGVYEGRLMYLDYELLGRLDGKSKLLFHIRRT